MGEERKPDVKKAARELKKAVEEMLAEGEGTCR